VIRSDYVQNVKLDFKYLFARTKIPADNPAGIDNLAWAPDEMPRAGEFSVT
jgi:hypothetical protein